jgi:hypothetical protein
LAAAVLFVVFAIPAFAGPFSDVPSNHWAYRAVTHLQQEGIIVGYPDGTFKGDNLFTRYEMAMVIARIYDQLMEAIEDVKVPDGDWATMDDLEEYMDMVDDLIDEFADELEMIGYDIDDMKDWMWNIEDRVSALEKRTQDVRVSGVLRFKIEDIITNEYIGPYGTPYIGGTPGTSGFENFEVEELIKLAFSAQPAEFLKTYVDMWQIRSFIGGGIGGVVTETDNGYLAIDQAYVLADVYDILGWKPGNHFNRFTMKVGRLKTQFGAYGMIFDNFYRSRPGILFDTGGDRLDITAFMARNFRHDHGTPGSPSYQDGLGVGRIAYGFGDPKCKYNRTNYFAKVGVNYLVEGYGDEDGIGFDLDTEILNGEYLNRAKVEYVYMEKDQYGFSVKDPLRFEGHENSFIIGVDLYNDGNTRVNVQYADVGYLPGFTSADLNPFECCDSYSGVYGYNVHRVWETGINIFPVNFEGAGAILEHTWFDTLYTKLFFYDGTTQEDKYLPALVRLHLKYPLSEKADILLDYIHSGIDAPTLAKLRGTFLVSF